MLHMLHISDLHFPSENLIFAERELRNGLVELIEDIDAENLFFLISGDITFKGRPEGYREATRFFQDIINSTGNKIKPSNILLCPGNHDIVREGGFEEFNVFAYSLRKDNRFSYGDKSYVIYETETEFFLGINSCYHLDHQYGFVNIEELSRTLERIEFRKHTRKVAFTHHHLINQFQNDISSIRNASKLIILLDEYGFETVFHGHQHNNSNLVLGRSQMFAFGVQAPGFPMPGYTSGLNYYKINDDGLELWKYIYSRDNVSQGNVGGFLKNGPVQYSRKS
ncbi:metallophosphoesterase [Paenibacillus sp. PL2-23]|uniref:metallophosphoesterase family protein n=1 Tax=Paenibacillus sp. PL2-23 TaxID=2100729 RepID=UPI0030FCF875